MKISISDTFNQQLPADAILSAHVRLVQNACFSFVNPTPCSAPQLIHYSVDVAKDLGIAELDILKKDFLNVFSGNQVYPSTKPYAMCYGGHQFGHWAGQLGDGRAINLFEVKEAGQQWAVQLKGAGLTPYSRTADGLAVLRSSIREYLCSEAMHHLGVPTTKALSLILSGDQVLRDILYNGNPAFEKGAIVCRVAPSFIRFGSFQILSARKEIDLLRTLTNYTIEHFFAHLGNPSKDTYIDFLQDVANKTIDMVIHWERVGFVHGVMNTDNMSILGITIDYGPYGWLEEYDPNWTPNTTDARDARYRFGNQANISIWNVYQLASALYPLIEEAEQIEGIINNMKGQYETKKLLMMLQKLGLENDGSFSLLHAHDLESLMYKSQMDMTIFYRNLMLFTGINLETFILQLPQYSYAEDFDIYVNEWKNWLEWYGNIILKQKNPNRQSIMLSNNPKYVLRNYMAQLAIDAADKGNYEIIEELYQILKHPYDEQPEHEHWFAKRPEWARHKIGCSMLSCSS